MIYIYHQHTKWWNTPLCLWFKSGIDFQTTVNRSEKQVCWWNCWQVNYVDARDITSVPRLLALKYFSLCHKKKEKTLRFQENACSYLLQVWYEFGLLHTCLSALELEDIIMKCNHSHSSVTLMQHQLWDLNPAKIRWSQSEDSHNKFTTSSLWSVLQGLSLHREHNTRQCDVLYNKYLFLW